MSPVLSLLLLDGAAGSEGDAELGSSLLRTTRSLALQRAGAWELAVPGLSPAQRDAAHELFGDRLRTSSDPVTSRAEAIRAGLSAATGDYVGILGVGDEVEPGVLDAAADYLAGRPSVDVLYTDEQWPAPGSAGIATKPDWSPHLLQGRDYLGRLTLLRRGLLGATDLDGLVDGAEEWDLHLRFTERATVVEHLPVIGVSRLAPPPSVPVAAAVTAVQTHLSRTGVRAQAEPAGAAGQVRVWREVADPPLVSIVIPTGGGRREVRGEDVRVLDGCLRSLVERTTYPRWEVVLVTSAGTPPEVVTAAQEILGDRLTTTAMTGPFSFSGSINEGVRLAHGELVLLLNDDTEVIEPRWLDRMVGVLQDPQVGAVGAKLLYEDGRIQHVGIAHDDAWLPIHPFQFTADDDAGGGLKSLDAEYLAVTAACLLTSRTTFVEVGGMTTELPLNFNDVDFCHKLTATGQTIICTPFARLHHYESTTRQARVEPFELDYLREHTLGIAAHDPHPELRSTR